MNKRIAGLIGLTLASIAIPAFVIAAVRPTEGDVVRFMLKDNKLVSYSGTISWSSKIESTKVSNNQSFLVGPDNSYSLSFKGYVDDRDLSSKKTYVAATFPAGLLGQRESTFSYIKISDKEYIQVHNDFFAELLNSIPTSTAVSSTIPMPAMSVDTWFKFDKKEIVDTLKLDSWYETAYKELTKDQKRKIVLSAIKNRAISLRYAKEEVINGVPSLTYNVIVNKQNIFPFIKDITYIMDGEKFTKQEEKDFLNTIKEIKKIPAITISMDKSNFNITRLTARYSDIEKMDSGRFTSNFNLAVNFTYPTDIPSIAEPSNSVSVAKIFEALGLKDSLSTLPAPTVSVSKASVLPFKSIVSAKTSARDAKRLSDIKQIQTALELYYTDTNAYPVGRNITLGKGFAICLTNRGWQKKCSYNTKGVYPYMSSVPSDPGSYTYRYTRSANGNSYKVEAQLDGEVQGLRGKIVLTPYGIDKR